MLNLRRSLTACAALAAICGILACTSHPAASAPGTTQGSTEAGKTTAPPALPSDEVAQVSSSPAAEKSAGNAGGKKA